jgi:hypothetical protein
MPVYPRSEGEDSGRGASMDKLQAPALRNLKAHVGRCVHERLWPRPTAPQPYDVVHHVQLEDKMHLHHPGPIQAPILNL